MISLSFARQSVHPVSDPVYILCAALLPADGGLVTLYGAVIQLDRATPDFVANGIRSAARSLCDTIGRPADGFFYWFNFIIQSAFEIFLIKFSDRGKFNIDKKGLPLSQGGQSETVCLDRLTLWIRRSLYFLRMIVTHRVRILTIKIPNWNSS